MEQREIEHAAAMAADRVLKTAVETAHALAGSTQVDIGYIKQNIAEIKHLLDSKYVSIDLFDPIKKLVYGLVWLVLASVVGGVMALIVMHK